MNACFIFYVHEQHIRISLYDVWCLTTTCEKWCLTGLFSELSGHCYFGVLVCVHTDMCVSRLVCIEWSVMRVG